MNTRRIQDILESILAVLAIISGIIIILNGQWLFGIVYFLVAVGLLPFIKLPRIVRTIAATIGFFLTFISF